MSEDIQNNHNKFSYSDLISKIHDIPILDVIEKLDPSCKLTRTGINFKAKCPFPGHNEKTPSFIVNPNKNICKCYGCGKGGDAITFVQLVRGYAKPWDAIVEIAKEYKLPIPDKKDVTPEDQAKYKLQEQLKIVYEAAAEFYKGQVWDPVNTKACEYLLSRTTREQIEKFEIGIAPAGWTGLYDHLRSKGFKDEILLESKLISEKNKKLFDFFRDRIMFPITDRIGSIIAFTGRSLPGAPEESPKYLNSEETPIFSKSKTLYGLSHARNAIAKKEGVYLVEGNFDVIRLDSIGVENVVAPCGTAFTEGQIAEIKRFTSNLVLIMDGDAAGLKAIDRSGSMAVQSGMNCNVIMLPSGDDKSDPDSFFTSREIFDAYKDENIKDYIVWKASHSAEKIKNFPDRRSKAINEICQLIIKYESASRREIYLEECSDHIAPRKLWDKEIASLTKEKKEKVSTIPQGLDMADVMRWGFYVDNNCYFFKKGESFMDGSNFIMRPLFHIESTINAKRLYEIINEHGYAKVIELMQKDLVSLQAFKLRVESLGNFLWKAGEAELNKLKSYLYEKTDSCIEITQLGWQKHGFFAWSNGIFNGEFKATDKHGIVNHAEKKYYLPASSDIYEHEDTLFLSERRFKHINNQNIDLYQYSLQLIEVFGNNAKIALAFYFATLFRDIIVRRFNFYPILNLFGPKGAGKTELAVSIMSFFGKQSKGPNINNTSKASLADHVAQVNNACVHIDEYKNNIDYEKIEFLKGLWDCTGRTRMNMDKDKKKETTAVDCGVILSGQEMPIIDNALFSRLIFLTFDKMEYTEDQKKAFNILKETEKSGLTHITNQILSNRSIVLDKYHEAYDSTCDKLNEFLKSAVIEDRLYKNWAVVLAVIVCIEEKLNLPFTAEELIQQSAHQLLLQQKEVKSGNEFSAFWQTFITLQNKGDVIEDRDYKISIKEEQDIYDNPSAGSDKNKRQFESGKELLFLKYTEMISLYCQNAKSFGFNPLNPSSIKFHLTTHKSFLGYAKNVSMVYGGKRFNGFTMVFDFKLLGIELSVPEYEKPKDEEMRNLDF